LARNIKKKLRVNNYNFANLTLILLLRYLVKYRSRSLAMYNNAIQKLKVAWFLGHSVVVVLVGVGVDVVVVVVEMVRVVMVIVTREQKCIQFQHITMTDPHHALGRYITQNRHLTQTSCQTTDK